MHVAYLDLILGTTYGSPPNHQELCLNTKSGMSPEHSQMLIRSNRFVCVNVWRVFRSNLQCSGVISGSVTPGSGQGILCRTLLPVLSV